MINARKTAIILAACSSYLALAACGEKTAEQPPVRPVLTQVVTPSDSRNSAIVGTVQPQIKTDFSFRVLGRLIARPVNIGDTVEKDQLLAAIDAAALEPAVRSAAAQLSSAQGQLVNAAAIEQRQKTLIESGSTTKSTLESAEQGRAAAESAVVRAQANLTKMREQLTYAKVAADYAGVVTAVGAEVGQVVAPGQTVVTVARPDIREAVIDVAESLAGALTIGMSLQVSLQLDPSVKAEGKVREIAPQSDPVTRSRRVRITLLSPPLPFRLGSTVITLIPGQATGGFKLPKTALLKTADQTGVWIVDPQTMAVSLRNVAARDGTDGSVTITRGLEAGDRVVVAGVNQIKSGQKVRLEQEVSP